MKYVKLTSRSPILITVFIIVAFCSFIFSGSKNLNEKIDQYYLHQISLVKKDIISIKQSAQKGLSPLILQSKFKSARLRYKKLAVLSEYFNVFDSRDLNGPALDRTEEDNPDKIIHPRGFQVMEQLLFEKWKPSSRKELVTLSDQMISVLSKLETEPDRINKFTYEQVYDALRSAVLRLATLGISGFDSPTAQYSIPEAVGTLEGIRDLLAIYRSSINEKNLLFKEVEKKLDAAIGYIRLSREFNSFDRLQFIRLHINPLYAAIIAARDESGILPPEGIHPVNLHAASIFGADAFNINFFAPYDRYGITADRIELGRRLFYDPILSGTGKRSCAGCHKPELAFSDGLPRALAMNEKTALSRNTPTLWNSALQTRQFYDSRVDMLEIQLNEVIHNEDEMKGSLKKSVKDLEDSEYKKDFKKAYADIKAPLSEYTIANALASYIRSLVALNARFDQYMMGDNTKLNAAEKNGFNLFMGKAKCGTCHYMPLFNGLVPPAFFETESEVLGVPKTKDKLHPQLDVDEGKFGFTRSTVHKFAFKTPTLRNIALTAPYMHNGVFNNLEEVMDFYNNGGGKGLHIAPPNQSLPFDKLNLTKKEKENIIAFMKTLTDTNSVFLPLK